MRKDLLAAAAVLTLLGVSSARAEETTVIHRDAPGTVVVDHPATESKSVTVKDHGDGCVSKTVRKENDAGDSKTVHKETCD